MSVSRTGDSVEAWDELEHQIFTVEVEVNESDWGTGLGLWQPVITIDPVDGLERDEVAELVALEYVMVLSDNKAHTDEARIRSGFEVSLEPTAKILPVVSNTFSQTQTFDKAPTDGGTAQVGLSPGTNIDSSTGGEDQGGILDTDVLMWDSMRTWNGAQDTTTGAGAGGENRSTHHKLINYRDEFGRGPEVDRHNNLFVHALMDIKVNQRAALAGLEARMHWNVFEE